MEFVRLNLCDNNYSYQDCSSMKMCIIGRFLANDVGNHLSFFKKWPFDENSPDLSCNATYLEKENDLILMKDLYSEEEEPTRVPFTYTQFIKLLDDWDEKVFKLRPWEVIIKCEDNQFIFETTFGVS